MSVATEYSSTLAAIRDGAVNLNDRAYSFRFCVRRARVCLSQVSVSLTCEILHHCELFVNIH